MFKAIAKFFVSIFGKKQSTRDKIRKAVDAVRRVINNPALDLAVELTNSGIDNQILYAVRELLGELYDELNPNLPNARLSVPVDELPTVAINRIRRADKVKQAALLGRLENGLTEKFVA